MAKKEEILKAILLTIGAVGFIAVAITAPNLISIFKNYQKTQKYRPKQISRSFKKLKDSKIITVEPHRTKTLIKLTELGQKTLAEYQLEEIKIPKLKKWDHRWRLVIFDIPNEFDLNRRVFSRRLRKIGLEMVQKSIWVSPYPCEKEIDYLKNIYSIRKFVRLVTAESMDFDRDLVQKFNIS